MLARRPYARMNRGRVRRKAAEGGEFPWSGNTNVNAWLTQSAYITDTSGDVDSWQTQQAYTAAGASTTYTFSQSGSARPAFSAAGDGSVAIDGTAEYLVSSDADLVDLPEGTDTEIAIITKMTLDSTASGDAFWGFFLTTANNPCHRLIRAGSNFRTDRFYDDGSSDLSTASETASDTSTHVIVERVRTSPSYQLVHEFDGSVDSNSPHALTTGKSMTGFNRFAIGASFRNSVSASNFAGITIEKGFFIVRNNDAVIADIVSWLQS